MDRATLGVVPSRSDKPRPSAFQPTADDLDPLEPDKPWDSEPEAPMPEEEPTGPTAVAQETASLLEPVEEAQVVEAAQTLDQPDDEEEAYEDDDEDAEPEATAKDTLDLDDEDSAPKPVAPKPPRRKKRKKPALKPAGADVEHGTFSGKSPDQLHGRKVQRLAAIKNDGFESGQSAPTLTPAGPGPRARPSMKLGPVVVESTPLNIAAAVLTVLLLGAVGWMLWGLFG